jgi:O-antigen/teichoic acid export membrane protein
MSYFDAFLNKIEKILKTDVRYIMQGGFWLGSGQVLTTGALLALSVAFANLLPKETYGTYRYVLSLVSILSIPTLSGIDPAVTQAVARGYEGTLFPGFKTKIKWGTLTTLASVLVGFYYYLHGNTTLMVSFFIVAFCVPLSEAFDIYISLLNGKKLFKKFTFYNVGTQLLLTAAMIISLVVTKNVIALVFVFFVSNVLLNIFYYWRTIKTVPMNTAEDPTTIGYGKNLSLIYIISSILTELDKVLVFHALGAANLAIYTFAISPPEQIKGLLKNVNVMAMPRFAKRSAKEIHESIFHKALRLGIFVTIIIFIYIFLAPLFYKIFFPKYVSSVVYSQILALSIISVSISMFLYTVLESQAMKKELYEFNLYSNIFNLAILFPLIFYFGLMGAVFARIISRLFTLVVSIVLVNRLKKKA